MHTMVKDDKRITLYDEKDLVTAYRKTGNDLVLTKLPLDYAAKLIRDANEISSNSHSLAAIVVDEQWYLDGEVNEIKKNVTPKIQKGNRDEKDSVL